jgi:hypothetical protein
MTTAQRRSWTVLERICLSLYGGIVIPFVYFVILIVLLGVLRSRLPERVEEWLFFPLFWATKVFERVCQPRIEAVGDVFGALGTEIVAILLINWITYSLLTYVSLWVVTKTEPSAKT